ncbi:hypothetical protein L873DRAFT_1847234 [Choiromyces venosus 120613-1]|uniref:Uncharacterized protein n=1 Tax=Choiromyces venosus 120613-1 TaxID=1336337 RepID=A0A3N4J503_9PEZI|nr:hypothetical protein L873DRAFT_1847234 [Choiromyces venosus 120613-1]
MQKGDSANKVESEESIDSDTSSGDDMGLRDESEVEIDETGDQVRWFDDGSIKSNMEEDVARGQEEPATNEDTTESGVKEAADTESKMVKFNSLFIQSAAGQAEAKEKMGQASQSVSVSRLFECHREAQQIASTGLIPIMHEPHAQQSLIQVKEERIQKVKKYVCDLKVRLNSKQVQKKEGFAGQCKRMTNWYEEEKLELEVHKVIAGLGTALTSQKLPNTVTNYLMSDEYGDAILEDLQLA